MNASWSRIRLGLYAIVLLALVTAATIALVSIGGDDSSKAAAGAPPTATVDTLTPSALPSSRPSASPTTSSPARSTSPGGSTGTTHRSTSPAPASTGPASSKPARAAGMRSHMVNRPTKIYTVQRGDNLWDIAQWFDLQGYRPLYAWNKTVIGQNPSLIFPGQKIIVVPGGQVSVRNG